MKGLVERKGLIFTYVVVLASLAVHVNVAYTPSRPPSSQTKATTRRDFGVKAAAALLITATPDPSLSTWAFDGSGASASSGLNPQTKAEKKKSYQKRVVADVKDFIALGSSIDNGGLDGTPAWTNFFITFQRREPDAVGRSYAALVDLRGLPINKKKTEFEGGDGLLLANTFTKAGKPPDNTPAVKSFKKLSPAFDPIETAGKRGDAKAAKEAWEAAKGLLLQYLTDVELPASLNDPLYN